MTVVDKINFPNYLTNKVKNFQNFEIVLDYPVLELFINEEKNVLSIKFFVKN